MQASRRPIGRSTDQGWWPILLLDPLVTAYRVRAIRFAGSLNDQPVRIAAIKPSVATLQCTWAPGPGNDATLKIQATNHAESAAATIEVRLAGPPDAVVIIPVSVRAAE